MTRALPPQRRRRLHTPRRCPTALSTLGPIGLGHPELWTPPSDVWRALASGGIACVVCGVLVDDPCPVVERDRRLRCGLLAGHCGPCESECRMCMIYRSRSPWAAAGAASSVFGTRRRPASRATAPDGYALSQNPTGHPVG